MYSSTFAKNSASVPVFSMMISAVSRSGLSVCSVSDVSCFSNSAILRSCSHDFSHRSRILWYRISCEVSIQMIASIISPNSLIASIRRIHSRMIQSAVVFSMYSLTHFPMISSQKFFLSDLDNIPRFSLVLGIWRSERIS